MGRFRSVEDCRRKANQCWELAGCARVDGDRKDELKRTEEARLWDQRAREGGYEEEENQDAIQRPKDEDT